MKHIAFDLGAESGRAIIGQIIDGKLEMEEIHRFKTQGIYVNGSFRWDVYRLFAELKEGLKQYAIKYGDEPCTMGVDTWGVDFSFIDKNGKLCGIPYHYRDSRTVGTSEYIDKELGLDTLYNMTGVQQMELNSLNQIIAAKNTGESVFDVADKLLYIGDILHYFLCGTVKNEYTIATTSNMYNVMDSCYEDRIYDVFGIEKKLQTDISFAGDTLGKIREDLASEMGISPKCTVISPAVHDTASAAAAIPAESGNVAYISSGTWSLTGLELDDAVVNEQSRALNIANYGGVLGKKLFIKNVMGLWLIQQCKKQWNISEPDLEYGEIVKRAQKAQPFCGYINPDDSSFLNPDNMPKAICDFLAKTGQTALETDDTGQIARIVFECLALKYRFSFEGLSGAADRKLDALNIIGGGVQNKMLSQFTASALGVKVVAGPIEATAIGNVLMQAYGNGEIKSLNELRSIVINTFEPEEYMPLDENKWEESYKMFCEICMLKKMRDRM